MTNYISTRLKCFVEANKSKKRAKVRREGK